MTKNLPERKLKEQDFNALSMQDKQDYIIQNASQFADMVLLHTEKWKQPVSAKILGMMIATVIMHKAHNLVSDEEILTTFTRYLEGINFGEKPSEVHEETKA